MVKIATRIILEILRAFILLVWSVLGAIFWLPFLVRMTAFFTVMVLSSVSKGGSIGNAEKGLNAAVIFYVHGFQKINEGINNIIQGKAGQDNQAFEEKGSFQSLVLQVVYAIIFWTGTIIFAGTIFFPEQYQLSDAKNDSITAENISNKDSKNIETEVTKEPNKEK